MDEVDFKEIYGISNNEKQDLINRISEDISWTQDELINSELDYENIEEEN